MPLVKVQREGRIVRLILNRGDQHNALVPELLGELQQALQTLHDPAPGAIVLQAEGPSFSTGGDVRRFHEHRHAIEPYARHLVGLLNECMLGLMSQPAPVICAVHGMVCGGSLGLLLASDVVLMTPDVTITPYYGVVGFSPDGGWTALLPEIIGRHRTSRVLLENHAISAEQAVAWGLANELVDGDVQQAALSAAGRIAAMVPGSNAATRKLLRQDLDQVRGRLEAEREAFVAQITTEQARLGMKRFLKIP